MQFLSKIFQNKLSRDIAWTIGSFSILAVSGIVINLVVAAFRDAAALGVFNLAYAVYIIASQIAVLGIHYSVLRYSAYYENNPKERGGMLFTAGALALVLGLITGGIVFFAAPFLADLFDSEATGEAIRYAAFGMLLFPLNKVLISYLNGLRHMRAFAFLQANRYVLVMVWVACVSISTISFSFSTLGFLLAEALTTLAALGYLLKAKLLQEGYFDLHWVTKHLAFGSKSLLAGMFVEMNSRIDVLLLGVFLTDRHVGIYSFAAMLVDGLYHVLAMIRINFNPVLVATTRDRTWDEGRRLLSLAKRYGYVFTAIFSAAIFVVFVIIATYLVPAKGLNEGTLSLLILLCGLTLIAAFVPFDNILMVSGHPAYQTLQHLAVICTNVALNLSLVPHLGIEGAALATAASYLIGIVVLIVLTNKLLGWNLITNSTPV